MIPEPAAELPDIELRGVTKHYGTSVAVRGIDLVIARGSFVTLLGPSGCGKTTTLRMIGGFEEPSAGDILVRGRSVAATPSRQRNTRMVFQSYALFPHMTVAQNVGYGLRMQRTPRGEVANRVAAALEMTGIAGKANSYPRDMSGGQQQRTALARALVTRPAVLLLDEPLGALDLKMRRQLQAELKSLQREVGITFVYVTHDQEEALAMSDRIVVMQGGSIAQQGTPTEIYRNPASPYVADFVGETNLLRWQRPAGETVIAVRPERIAIGPSVRLDGQVREGGSGLVTGVTFLGPIFRIAIRLADGQIVRADTTQPAEMGAPVDVHWLRADALAFDSKLPHTAAEEQAA